MASRINTAATVISPTVDGQDPDPDPSVLWLTNRFNNPRGAQVPDNPSIITMGIWNQIQISMGLPSPVSQYVLEQI